ncbi:hypothetical protein HPB50_027309 [Hyalomma asiaticum]|uniref:Uncharacterized protein n=1 Tax=Hyalomma asiaticum TaxID=266040 RepID=A0ACB7SEY4_HYAAI|nr:hypothetical protein HPB50_027309 [Hyalomma asiaticum]
MTFGGARPYVIPMRPRVLPSAHARKHTVEKACRRLGYLGARRGTRRGDDAASASHVQPNPRRVRRPRNCATLAAAADSGDGRREEECPARGGTSSIVGPSGNPGLTSSPGLSPSSPPRHLSSPPTRSRR